MEIGKPERTIIVEPLEDPFVAPPTTPEPERERPPAPVEDPDRELIPA